MTYSLNETGVTRKLQVLVNGTLTNAGAVSLTVLQPDATITAPITPANASTGVYTYTPTLSQAGHYVERWVVTGTGAGIYEQSFDVAPAYGNPDSVVSVAEFLLYLGNPGADTARAQFILDRAVALCQTIVNPLPAGADLVVLDVAERAYANPTTVGGTDLGLYSEGVGPYSTDHPGTGGGGLYLTQGNKASLRRLAGSGGAFSIDMLPADYAPDLPWWDTGSDAQFLGLP